VPAEREVTLPPIVARRSRMSVIDRWTRIRAALLPGRTDIEGRFFDGDEVDALITPFSKASCNCCFCPWSIALPRLSTSSIPVRIGWSESLLRSATPIFFGHRPTGVWIRRGSRMFLPHCFLIRPSARKGFGVCLSLRFTESNLNLAGVLAQIRSFLALTPRRLCDRPRISGVSSGE
jgi:hypothetical protein